MEYFIVALTCLIVGFLVGVALDSKFSKNRPTFGELKIDTSAEDKDVYRLELNKIPLEDLPKYDSVVLKVVNTTSLK